MEAADDHVLEAVGLDLGPVLDLVGGDVLCVAGHVVGCVCVGADGSDDGHGLVILVGDGDLGSLVAERVDHMVDGPALGGVGLGAVHFIQVLDLGEDGLLGLVVGSAEHLGALEHQMLEVVGESGVVGRVVAPSRLHCDIGLDTGFFLVDGHVDLESVLEGVDLGLERVSLHGFVLGAAGGEGQHHGGHHQDDTFLHCIPLIYPRCKYNKPAGKSRRLS